MDSVTFDKIGYCAKCHSPIAKFHENGKIKEWLDIRDDISFKLSDESHMRVAICRPCKSSIKKSDYKIIMDSVKSGWEHEVRHKTRWNEKKKESYLNRYMKLNILEKIDVSHSKA